MTQIAALFLLFLLAGCTTIENQYTVTGDANRFSCDSTAAPIKTITPTISAAASQTGPAGAEAGQ